MNRRGIKFILMQAKAGLWQWQFRIGKTGKTKTNLKGMTAYRVQQRFDRELRKPRALGKSPHAP